MEDYILVMKNYKLVKYGLRWGDFKSCMFLKEI